MSKEKEFREKLKVDNRKVIEEFIRQERAKVVKDKRLSNMQKREKVELLDEALLEIQIASRHQETEECIRRRNEEAWEK